MAAKLVVLAGPEEGRIIEVPEEASTTLGRGDAAAIRIADGTVSRVHCSIEIYGGTAMLKDAGSKTGTRVDGKAVKDHELRTDNIISIGTTKMRFVMSAPANEAADVIGLEPEPPPEPKPIPEERYRPGSKKSAAELEPHKIETIGLVDQEIESLRKPGSTRPANSTFTSPAPPGPQAKQPPPVKEEPEEAAEGIEELRKLAGTKLAHFQIGPAVGIGSSGLVFKAKDTKDDREVALKVYTPEFAEDDEALHRFIRAAKTMMPMRHSNLVTLYGAGKTGPYCWMAMDYVEGENLRETIARIGTKGKLDWRPALRMSIDIGRGLYYIHGENIIHRSLSPGNLLVSKVGTVKLGSLILAKALSGALSKDVTVSGNFLGEVSYLSPEQVGAGGAVDQRADIYSFGALMYALLTGKPPHVGKNPLETATWIIRRELVSPRKADPNIPPALEKIVVKMLQKSPADRFQTAGELLAELESLPLA